MKLTSRTAIRLLSSMLGALAIASAPSWAQVSASNTKTIGLTVQNFTSLNISIPGGTFNFSITLTGSGIANNTQLLSTETATMTVNSNVGWTVSLGSVSNPSSSTLGVTTTLGVRTTGGGTLLPLSGSAPGTVTNFKASLTFPSSGGAHFPNYTPTPPTGTITITISP